MQSVYPHAEAIVARLKWQFWVINFLIVAHIIITAYTDPLDDVSLTVAVLTVRWGPYNCTVACTCAPCVYRKPRSRCCHAMVSGYLTLPHPGDHGLF